MLRIAEVFWFSALRVAFHHSNVDKSLSSSGTASEVNRRSWHEVGMKLTWRLRKYAQNKHGGDLMKLYTGGMTRFFLSVGFATGFAALASAQTIKIGVNEPL